MSVKTKKKMRAESAQTAGRDIQIAKPPALQKAMALIQRNDYAAAANLLSSAGRDLHIRNALGVCFMRMGKVDEAVNLFRSFVLIPGTTTERPEISNACKRNFATALLMKGMPSGTVSVLVDTQDIEHPMAVRIFAAIKQWEKTLSWFRRMDWKLCNCEPGNCHVPLDFEPGEFDIEVQPTRPVPPVDRAVNRAVSVPKLAA